MYDYQKVDLKSSINTVLLQHTKYFIATYAVKNSIFIILALIFLIVLLKPFFIFKKR